MNMKTIVAAIFALFISITASAQKDSLKAVKKGDTIDLGGIIILKKGTPDSSNRRVIVTVGRPEKDRDNDNVHTSTLGFDIGFSNWIDHTNYAAATANEYFVNRPGKPDITQSDMKLKTIKSINVNIWFFMQRLSLIKEYVNLKYGLGLSLNNYRFTENITFHESGFDPYNVSNAIPHPFIFRDSIDLNKNKLAADYITVPLMLNFKTNPDYSNKGLRVSAGVSMGFLYSSRNKQKSDARGKEKRRGDFDLDQWKFSYVAELGLGPVTLYGSYSPESIFTNDAWDYRPYTIGIRLFRL